VEVIIKRSVGIALIFMLLIFAANLLFGTQKKIVSGWEAGAKEKRLAAERLRCEKATAVYEKNPTEKNKRTQQEACKTAAKEN